MKITIAERLKPFSHTPGAACLIPGTTWEIEAFPALIRLGKKYEIFLHLQGPVKDFTLEQDLEKNFVSLFGKAKEGFYRLRCEGKAGGVEVTILNAPTGFLVNGKSLRAQERLFFADDIEFFLPKNWERLSLGVSKAQDWDLVLRRFDLREILPVLYGLSQKIPYLQPEPLTGTGRLLADGNLEAFCRAAFSKILIPRLSDDQHQGLAPSDSPSSGNPCNLLQEAYRRIRNLFFVQEGNVLKLLPACDFPAGRMTQIQVSGIGEIDLEWASRTLRRAILRAAVSGEVAIAPKGLHSFRVRTTSSQRGTRHPAGDPLQVESGKTYFLDRFHR